MEGAFLCLDKKSAVLEDSTDITDVLLQVLGEDKNVVQIHKHKMVDHVMQYVID